jgi:maleate isomerase
MQASATKIWRLGMLVPSSNTVLEPETAKLLPPDGSVTTHVSRLGVVRIAPDAHSHGQFDIEQFLAASRLLSDAKVDLILWNGTSASWLGFDWDEKIAEAIEQDTGTRATSAVTAINQELATIKATRIGLVTPYVAALEARIIENYASIGITVIAAERLDLTVNAAFGEVPPQRIGAMVRAVAEAKPEAIVIMCTNLAGASIAEPLGRELGIPVIDSVRAAVLHSVRLMRESPVLPAWG